MMDLFFAVLGFVVFFFMLVLPAGLVLLCGWLFGGDLKTVLIMAAIVEGICGMAYIALFT